MKRRLLRQDGFVIVYMAVVTTALLLFTGLAVDTGRAYLVKAQLSKAVDGAALGAARMLNSGDPRGEATRIFKANFPPGYLGTTTSTDPTANPGFFATQTISASGVNIVTVKATAVLPTTFMKLAKLRYDDGVQHRRSDAENGGPVAGPRRVELHRLRKWPAVRDAARAFINGFDANGDRLSLITFGNGASVIDAMPSSRGFDKPKVTADVANNLPGGSTNMVEGLYRGWDELRSVATGSQSGLRVIVLFTDGASNGVDGIYDGLWNVQGPSDVGLSEELSGSGLPDLERSPNRRAVRCPDRCGKSFGQPEAVELEQLGPREHHRVCSGAAAHDHPLALIAAPGIPTTFPLQSATLKVNGAAQNTVRGLRHKNGGTGKYPAEIFNINNAARNLLEIMADQARNDNGDYKIRLYTIGMGELVQYNLGTMPEKPEDILKRIANDGRSPDFNTAQLEGKFYFAQTESDVAPAFAALQSEIVRLTK